MQDEMSIREAAPPEGRLISFFRFSIFFLSSFSNVSASLRFQRTCEEALKRCTKPTLKRGQKRGEYGQHHCTVCNRIVAPSYCDIMPPWLLVDPPSSQASEFSTLSKEESHLSPLLQQAASKQQETISISESV